MNIDDILKKKAEVDEAVKKLEALGISCPTQVAVEDHGAWVIGENYFVRTVTHITTGRLVAYTSQELVMEDAAWIADTGRYADNLVSCEFNEVEPYPKGRKVIVGRGGIIDAVQIDKLPLKQK